MHLLLKGGLRLGCDALKQPAKPNVLERLERCFTAAVIKAEIEPLSTHPIESATTSSSICSEK